MLDEDGRFIEQGLSEAQKNIRNKYTTMHNAFRMKARRSLEKADALDPLGDLIVGEFGAKATLHRTRKLPCGEACLGDIT